MAVAAKQKGRKRAGAYHHGDLRAALIAKASGIVDEAGPEAVSLKAIAQMLGVSQPAPYMHFADRNALLIAVALKGLNDFLAVLQEHAGDLAGLSRAYVRFAREHPGLYRLMFGSKLLKSVPPDSELKLAGGASFRLLVEAIAPYASPVRARRRAKAFWAGLHGLVVLDQEQLLDGPMTDQTTVDELIDDLVAAIRTSSRR